MIITDRIRLVRVRSTPDDVSSELRPHRDECDVIARCNLWRKVFRASDVAYPATVLAIPAAAQWVRERGCEVDAHSPQGITFAMSARVSPARVLFHCDNATGRTITDALDLGVGKFIVDSTRSAVMLGACAERPQHVLVDASNGDAAEVLAAVAAEERLTLAGVFSQADDPERAVLCMLEQIADLRHRSGLLVSRIGLAVRGRYAPDALALALCDYVDEGCAKFRLPRPAMTIFPDWMALTHDM
jgi:hypothetical protein